MRSKYVHKGPHAAEIPTNSGDTVQEELDKVSVSASPGFTWGRAGFVPAGAWLLNDGNPSNITGRRVFLTTASLIKIFVSNATSNTFDVGIYEHTGSGTEVLLHTISLVGVRSKDETLNVSLTNGKELAARVTAGSANEVEVGVIISGTL